MYLRKGKHRQQDCNIVDPTAYDLDSLAHVMQAARSSIMKLERDLYGDFFVEPSLLAERLRLTASELRRMMRLGLVTSSVEAGTGPDEGQNRLTVRRGNFVWRAVLDVNQKIISEESLNLLALSSEQARK